MKTEFYTNIKNLPEGRTYFTESGYSQSYPWVELSRTAKTVTLAKVDVAPDPEWAKKREFYPGGFAGHCANQSEQTWLFAGIDESRTKTIRLTKKGWAYKGTRFTENRAVEFYDYNF
jgi:hypothetical protein